MQQTPPPPHLTTPPFYVERPPPVKSNYEYERSISLKEVSSGWDLKKERFQTKPSVWGGKTQSSKVELHRQKEGGDLVSQMERSQSAPDGISLPTLEPRPSLSGCAAKAASLPQLGGPPLLLPFLPLPPFTIPPPSHIQPQYRWSQLGEHFNHIFQIKYQAKMKGEQTHLEVTIFFPPFPSQPASDMGSLPQYR